MIVLLAASAATAQSVAGPTPSPAVENAQGESVHFGAEGLFWLSAGLFALVVGLVLATRLGRRPVAGIRPPSTRSAHPSSISAPGGAEK